MWPFKKKKNESTDLHGNPIGTDLHGNPIGTDLHGNPSGAGCIVPLTNSGLTKAQSESLYRGECPDCGSDLFKGPCGGMMMNVRCEKGHRFNITNPEIQDVAPFFAERI